VKILAAFVMRGRWQSVLGVAGLAVASMAIPLMSLFSSAALGLVALRRGARESFLVLCVSAAVAGLSGMFLTGSSVVAMTYGLLLWVPVWPVAILLRSTAQLGLTLEAAALLALLVVLGIFLVLSDPAALWQETLLQLVQPMFEHAPAGFDRAQVSNNLSTFAHYMTGVAVAGSLAGLVFGLLVARWWQAMLFNPGGFRTEFVALRLHAASGYAWLAVIGLGVLADGVWAELAWNLSIPFFVPFVTAGFAVLHAMLAMKRFWLIGLYVAPFFLPQLLLPVAFMGFSDIWLKWRGRLSPA
jgi:hypothetical protein